MWRFFCSDVSYTGVFNRLQSRVVWWRLHQKLSGKFHFSFYRFHDSDVRRRCLLKSNAIWFLIKGSLLKYEAFITWDLISVTLFGTVFDLMNIQINYSRIRNSTFHSNVLALEPNDLNVLSLSLSLSLCVCVCVYRVSQEECARLREGVPYVKVYPYNPKHLCPKLNGYGDNGQRSLKLWQLLHTYWLPNTY